MNGSDTLGTRIDTYLASRRQAGFALDIDGQQLKRFAAFAEQVGHRGPVTVKLAMRWATDSRGKRPLTAARRIEVLRPFYRYWQQFDPATEIPPRWLCGRAHRRLTPHIFTDHEIRSLLVACRRLYPVGGLRGQSCAAIFGLIAATGLRISEATGLTRSDVDLERLLLHIRRAKFGKERWVPIHASVASTRLSSCELHCSGVPAAAIPHRAFTTFVTRLSAIGSKTGTHRASISTAVSSHYPPTSDTSKSPTPIGT